MRATVRTIELRVGDVVDVCNDGRILRTIASVDEHPDDADLRNVRYEEGRTPSWSGGNLSNKHAEWSVVIGTELGYLPPVVRQSANLIALNHNEMLIGWQAITRDDPEHPGRVIPDRYRIVTDKSTFEVSTGGLCTRATVLHKF